MELHRGVADRRRGVARVPFRDLEELGERPEPPQVIASCPAPSCASRIARSEPTATPPRADASNRAAIRIANPFTTLWSFRTESTVMSRI